MLGKASSLVSLLLWAISPKDKLEDLLPLGYEVLQHRLLEGMLSLVRGACLISEVDAQVEGPPQDIDEGLEAPFGRPVHVGYLKDVIHLHEI